MSHVDVNRRINLVQIVYSGYHKYNHQHKARMGEVIKFGTKGVMDSIT